MWYDMEIFPHSRLEWLMGLRMCMSGRHILALALVLKTLVMALALALVAL